MNTTNKRPCLVCGEDINKQSKFFCSQQCSGKHKAANPRRSVVCDKCGGKFKTTSPSKRFCTKVCKGSFDLDHSKHCGWCGEIFYKRFTRSIAIFSKIQFCSSLCLGSYRAEQSMTTRVCPRCKIEFSCKRVQNKKYCSKKCVRIPIPAMELLESTKIYGGKRAIAKKYGVDPAIITRRLKELL